MHTEPMNGHLAVPESFSNANPKSGLTVRNGVLAALGFAPLLWLFCVNLWARPHYQFFPLALGGAGFLAWIRFKEISQPLQPGRLAIGAGLLSGSFMGLGVATFLWSPWVGSLAALTGLVAVIWLRGGSKLLRAMTPALLLVLIIIPPPLALDTRLAESLRVLAVNWSSHVLDL